MPPPNPCRRCRDPEHVRAVREVEALEMAQEQGLTVDEAGFRALMAEQRARAKADAG